MISKNPTHNLINLFINIYYNIYILICQYIFNLIWLHNFAHYLCIKTFIGSEKYKKVKTPLEKPNKQWYNMFCKLAGGIAQLGERLLRM